LQTDPTATCSTFQMIVQLNGRYQSAADHAGLNGGRAAETVSEKVANRVRRI
jgi:hypothetical protein